MISTRWDVSTYTHDMNAEIGSVALYSSFLNAGSEGARDYAPMGRTAELRLNHVAGVRLI